MDCRVATLLDFVPEDDGEEAGLTTFMSDSHHYEVAVTRRQGRRVVLLRRRVADLQSEEACAPLPEGPVGLACDATPEAFAFSYTTADGMTHPLGAGNSRLLSAEVASVFTGMYFGVYATGNGRPCRVPADFDWFEVSFAP
ncbi:MAG: hypothetical protein WCQ57_11090 [Verrucomicrobiota bacterium]